MNTNPSLGILPISAFGFRPSFGLRISAFGFWYPIVLVMFFALPRTMCANTNLTTTLQQALFEEEANHNLNAAIQSYQSLVTQFDQDRKLAATAVFRLGECYRKQGNTNDATAQYERILRDFSDQSNLLTLSRQNLAAFGVAAPSSSSSSSSSTAARQEQKRLLEEEIKLVEKQLASQQKLVDVGRLAPDELLPARRDLLKLRRQLAALDTGQSSTDSATDGAATYDAERYSLETRIAELKALPKAKLRVAVQQSSSNPVLTSLMEQLVLAEQRLASEEREYGPEHREVLKAKTIVETVTKQIDTQVEAAMEALEARRNALASAASPASRSAAGPGASTSAEAEEVKRIQALIKDSPDLINSSELLQTAAGKGELAIVKLLLDNGAAVDGIKQLAPTPLHYAAANGHKAVVDLLLSKGAKADARTEYGGTPLHLAALKGYEQVAKALLAAGAPVDARIKADAIVITYSFKAGQTPFHVAVNAGYTAIAELLLSKGADVNAEDGEGRTALSHAAANGDVRMSAALLAAHADSNAGRRDLPLVMAALRGDAALLELLLSKGANPNTNCLTFSVNGHNKVPPLYVAVFRRQPEAVKILTRVKADPNFVDSQGKPLLFDLLLPGGGDTLKALLDGGANPNQSSKDGFTPLAMATHNKNQPAVEALLAHGANPNAKIEASYGEGGKGYTPLLIATAQVSPEIVDVLLAAKADPNLRSDTRAPILNVMNNENPPARKQMLASLLDHGAKPDARDGEGKTPLIYAVLRADHDSASLLLAHKADVNAAPADGNTALHLAVANNRQELVELLLANQADPNARNNAGQTPLDLAKRAAGQPGLPGAYPGGSPLSYQWTTPGMPGIPSASPSSFAARLASIQHQSTPGGVPPNITPGAEAESSPPSIADLLRQHGAADELPDFSIIRITRKGMGPWVIFKRDTNSFNRFSLFETLANFAPNGVPFPALNQIKIHRPIQAKPGSSKEIPVNPMLTPSAFDCAKDLLIEFGDVVEIPEREHTLSESGNYLSGPPWESLKSCLTRKVRFVVRGQTAEIALGGFTYSTHLSQALQRQEVQNILRSSSDFSRVHVKRTDPDSKKAVEFTENVRSIWDNKTPSSDDLWLRDGDVIEVPDKSE